MKDVELWKDVKGVVQLEIVLAGPYGDSDREGGLRLCRHPKASMGSHRSPSCSHTTSSARGGPRLDYDRISLILAFRPGSIFL